MIDEFPPEGQEYSVTPLGQKNLEDKRRSWDAQTDITLMMNEGTFISRNNQERRGIISEAAIHACQEFLGDERNPDYQIRVLQLTHLAMRTGYREMWILSALFNALNIPQIPMS